MNRPIIAVYGAILRVLCKATGRNNFFFARGAWLLSLPVTIVGIVYYWPSATSQGWIIVFPLSILLMKSDFKTMRRVESRLDEGVSDAFPFKVNEVVVARLYGLFLVLLVPFSGLIAANKPVQMAAIIIWNLLAAASQYFILDIHPRSKGPIKRAVEWFQAHRPRLPQLLPNPTSG